MTARAGIWCMVLLLAATLAFAADGKEKRSVVFKSTPPPADSVTCKPPVHRQGVICDFEDQLSRKKVPLNFQLGNSKY